MSFGLTGTVATRGRRAACLALAILFVGSLVGRAEEPWAPPADGTHVLRAILNQQLGDKLEAITPSQIFEDPKHTLIIIFGSPTWPQGKPSSGKGNFIQGGGAVLLATDQITTENWVGSIFGATVDGNFLQTNQVADQYDGLADCVLVKKPWAQSDAPIFKGVGQIATNKPSFLNMNPSSQLKPLAYFPLSAHNPDAPSPRENEDLRRRSRLVFAVGGDKGNGRVLLLADHSVFINQMLLPRAAWAHPPDMGIDDDRRFFAPEAHEPNEPGRGPQAAELIKHPAIETEADNFLFACNCVEWVTDKGNRNRVLFIEDGKVISDYRVSLKKPPPPRMPTPQQLLDFGDQAIDGLEKEDFFNRQAILLENLLGEHRDVLVPLFILAATFLFLLMTAIRLWLGSGEAVRAVAPSRLHGSTARASRSKAILQEGKYWEAAQFLAAQLAAAVPRSASPPPKSRPRISATAKPVSAKWFEALLSEYRAKRASPAPDNGKQGPRMA
jgi:hypothetical protein